MTAHLAHLGSEKAQQNLCNLVRKKTPKDCGKEEEQLSFH